MAELALEAANLRAHPGLGDIQPAGGLGEASLLGDCDKVFLADGVTFSGPMGTASGAEN